MFEPGCAWAEPTQLHVKGSTVHKQRLRRARSPAGEQYEGMLVPEAEEGLD